MATTRFIGGIPFALALILGVVPGCANIKLLDLAKFKVPKATIKDPVVKIVCIWEAAEGQGLDGMPTRGFAGQILFFTHSQPSPVRVDGDIRVSVYDGQTHLAEDAQPVHNFDFMGDAWTIHLVDSALGPSYNLFVPYTTNHSWLANCSLRVRLTPKIGPAVYSELVHVTLPGPPEQPEKQAENFENPMLGKLKTETTAIKLGAQLSSRTIRPDVERASSDPSHAPLADSTVSPPANSTDHGQVSRRFHLEPAPSLGNNGSRPTVRPANVARDLE
jgi:hypothetical protein